VLRRPALRDLGQVAGDVAVARIPGIAPIWCPSHHDTGNWVTVKEMLAARGKVIFFPLRRYVRERAEYPEWFEDAD
jgi:hypothetical protein